MLYKGFKEKDLCPLKKLNLFLTVLVLLVGVLHVSGHENFQRCNLIISNVYRKFSKWNEIGFSVFVRFLFMSYFQLLIDACIFTSEIRYWWNRDNMTGLSRNTS